jgi:cytochrome c-type biogenesis protein CcmH/NrfG
MFSLYAWLILMLLVALGLLAIPFIKNRSRKGYIVSASLIALLGLAIYQFTGNKTALYLWMTQGKQHYQLLETFEQLGGIDGAIAQIESKLAKNPQDAQGWYILGKLYLSKNEEAKAQAAFAKSRELSR